MDHSAKHRKNGRDIFYFAAKMIRPFWKETIALIGLSLFWSIDFVVKPYLIKIILDRLATCPTPADVMSIIGFPIAMYLLMTCTTNFFMRVYDLLMRRVKPQLKKNTVRYLTRHVMRHTHRFFQTHFAGDLATGIQNVMQGVTDLFSITLDRFVSYSLALAIAVITISRINLYIGLILVAWIVVYLSAALICSVHIRVLSANQSHAQMRLIGNIVDIFTNMMSVRLFAGFSYEEDNIGQWSTHLKVQERARDLFFIKMWFFQGILFVLVLALECLMLVWGYQRGLITVGDFGLILTINISITHSLTNLSKDVSRLAEQWGLLSQGLNVMALDRQIENGHMTKELIVKQGEIRFDNVTFSHKNSEPLFNHLSVTIYPGQKVGLVGSSGGGKTTFAYLLLRLFAIQEGTIFVDNQDISHVAVDSLRRAIGMIPQDPSLFHRTLKENIKYGSFNATDSEVVDAAGKAHIDDFIDGLPQGYQTTVGERGSRLSGGQRQRIAIARAIIKDAPILILDEATSALDSLTEQRIQNSFTNLVRDKTTIIIAHRLSTLLYMDRILVFEQGAIVEDGSHQELLLKRGVYYRLWNAQVGGFLLEVDDMEHDEEQE
jgi:ATP-binding cassette, subfamily B, bacterial